MATAFFNSYNSNLSARELQPDDQDIAKPGTDLLVESNFNQDMKVNFLTKLLSQQQLLYEAKIAFLETELRKTKDRLIEKSMNQEKIEAAMIEKYSAESVYLKRELAYKIKSLLDYQRQIEKMKPSEDLKNVLKLNTELASEIRKSEDQIAVMQLKNVEGMPGSVSKGRLPASVNDNK
jgi:hypothetical protein